MFNEVFPLEYYLSPVSGQMSRQQVEQRCLTGPVGADNTNKLPPSNFKVDIVYGGQTPEIFPQPRHP